MTKNEKKLRAWMFVDDIRESTEMLSVLNALLAEHRVEVAAAMDAVLEEAAVVSDDTPEDVDHETVARRIRALKSQPARRFIDAERVREAVEALSSEEPYTAYPAARKFGLMLLSRLGLDLDATPGKDGAQ